MVLIFVVGGASAAGLTQAQMEQVQLLSPQEKAAISGQIGLSKDAVIKSAEVPATSPQTMKPRDPESSSLEQEVTRAGSGTAGVKERGLLRTAFSRFVDQSRNVQVDTRLQQFGYELFAGSPSTFAPATDVPVPPEYVLGPGDEIKVQFYGKENSNISMTVDRDGSIALPEIGPVSLAGLGFSDAKALIAQQIREKMIGVSTSITMGKLRSIRVFALGEVERPGSYVVSGLATLSHALFVSGGVKKTGSLRRVQLKRSGKLIATLDLYDFLLQGDTGSDVRLLPQDVVYVPPIGKTVGVAGQVLRPAIYELKGERRLGEVLDLSGGFRPDAYRTKIQIERIRMGKEREVADVLLDKKGLASKLRNGDLVKVFSILDFERNPVYLLGNVKRPGKYAWHKGMHLAEMLPDQEALKPETYLDYAVIERESGAEREASILHVPLGEVLAGRVRVELKPRDKVYVFNQSHFREIPQVEVVGSVQSPDSYRLKKNMRLVDLILAAGGLLRDAYRDEAELYRIDAESKQVSLQRVSLRAALGGMQTDNPLLRDQDRLVVHSIWEVKGQSQVTVSGEVKNPGEYKGAVNMRAADLIFAAGGITPDTLMGEAQIYRTDPLTKEISLITFNVKKALQRDDAENPLILDSDRVVIHSIWETKRRYNVFVAGAVKKPGEKVLAAGMRVSDLIFAAGSITERAFLKNAEITRYAIRNGEKRVSRHFQVNLEAALRGEGEANILLEPYDVLTVREMTNWREAEHVTVEGEVRFPGSYPIEEGERLSDLLVRVGGFGERAYLPAAVFIRESLRLEQQRQLDALATRIQDDIARQTVVVEGVKDASIAKRQKKSLETAKRVLGQLQSVKATGRLVIQLSDLKHFKHSEFDVRLRDGDKLYVPQRPDQVMVMGQVYNQSAFVYQEKLDLDDYIDMSGGTTRFADSRRIYVVRASGEVDPHHGFLSRPMQPGDVIVVPEELSQFNLVDSILDWSRVMMQVGVGVASMKIIGIL